MAFLSKAELNTHLYDEQVGEIIREDETVVTAAIDGAIAEAKGYLAKYDVPAIFADTGSNRHPLVLIFVKDMAVWHFINLSNPGIDYESRKDRYERAVAWLKGVQKGDIMPDLPTDDSTDNPGVIIYGSNPKRTQHF